MKKKKHYFEIQLNSIADTDNPTKKEVEFILHDFNVSHNYAFISKETAEKALHTLKGMPIVCKYYPKSDPSQDDDALGSHEMYIDKDRDTGEEIVAVDTVPIGVFTEDAYITTTTDNEGNEIEVVVGKGILWASRFPNVIGLLKEWIDNGITVSSSMEILYDSYKVEDGITEILNYWYEGHTILNSQDRGNHNKVHPAYDVSKLTKLVAEVMNKDHISQKNNKEGEKMKFKKVFELSHGDIRSLLYTQLDPTLGENTYSWIADVYEDYFIVNIYSFQEGNEFDKYYKFNYTKDENSVTIDFDSKKEVFLKRNWEEVADEEVQNQMNQLEEDVKSLKSQLEEKETSLETLKSEKDNIEKSFNEATDKLTKLNSEINNLKEYKEKFEKAEFEKSLNEKKEYYSAKFSAFDAMDKFETDEVQELIKKSVNENEEGKEAILQLNSMLVDMVEVKKENTKEESPVVKEFASKREDLIPPSDDFDSRYSI